MLILSLDCASKSLGVTLIKILEDVEMQLIQVKIKQITSDILVLIKYQQTNANGVDFNSEQLIQVLDQITKKLKEINNIQNSCLQLLYCDVFDLLPGKKVKETTSMLRSSRLKGCLNLIDMMCKAKSTNRIDKVLVEYQMNANDKSREVCSKIIQHYVRPDYNIDSFADCNKDYIKKFMLNVEKDDIKYPEVIIVKPAVKNTIHLSDDLAYGNFIAKYRSNYTANKNHCKENFLYWTVIFKQSAKIIGIKKKNLDDIADSFMMALAWISTRIGKT
jgi:hypothetical protein